MRYEFVTDWANPPHTLAYKQALADENGKLPSSRVFLGKSCSTILSSAQALADSGSLVTGSI